jgi:hypothetical protein
MIELYALFSHVVVKYLTAYAYMRGVGERSVAAKKTPCPRIGITMKERRISRGTLHRFRTQNAYPRLPLPKSGIALRICNSMAHVITFRLAIITGVMRHSTRLRTLHRLKNVARGHIGRRVALAGYWIGYEGIGDVVLDICITRWDGSAARWGRDPRYLTLVHLLFVPIDIFSKRWTCGL